MNRNFKDGLLAAILVNAAGVSAYSIRERKMDGQGMENERNTGNEWNRTAGNEQNTGYEWNTGNEQNTRYGWNTGYGQNTGNEWNTGYEQTIGYEQNNRTSQYSYYQDHTTEMPFYGAIDEPPEVSGTANGMQIASLVCGIAGMILGCCCIPYGMIIGIVLGIVGLVLAIVGNKQSRSGIGTGGLVCSIVAIVIGVIMLIFLILIFLIIGMSNPGAAQEFEYFYQRY